MCAAAVPHILSEQRASLLAEGRRGGAADAEVRDWNSAGADPALPGVGGGGGAPAGAGAGEEPDGGELRPELNPGGAVRGSPAGEGAGGGSPEQGASGGAWPGMITNSLRVKQSMHGRLFSLFYQNREGIFVL